MNYTAAECRPASEGCDNAAGWFSEPWGDHSCELTDGGDYVCCCFQSNCSEICEAAYPFTPVPAVTKILPGGGCYGIQMGGNCQAECSWWEVELPGSNCGGTQPKCCCGNCLINLNTWDPTQNCVL